MAKVREAKGQGGKCKGSEGRDGQRGKSTKPAQPFVLRTYIVGRTRGEGVKKLHID